MPAITSNQVMTMENATFSSGENILLQNISVHIPSNQLTMIFGKTSSVGDLLFQYAHLSHINICHWLGEVFALPSSPTRDRAGLRVRKRFDEYFSRFRISGLLAPERLLDSRKHYIPF
jgi:hypothetical protein